MADFKDAFTRKRAAVEASLNRQQEERDVAAERLRSEEERAIALLERAVVPLLKDAQSSLLEGEGVSSTIVTKYDVMGRAGFAPPQVIFTILGPKRKTDGYQHYAPPVIFLADRDGFVNIKLEQAHYSTDAIPRSKGPHVESSVLRGVTAAYEGFLHARRTWGS